MKKIKFCWMLVCFICFMPPSFFARSMDFHTVYNSQDKIRVIIGKGEIVDGDVERLRQTIPSADRDAIGNIALYLDSPGGSVKTAFEMVELMDKEEFSVMVGSNMVCLSACSSILYLSGRFHIVLGSGIIGFHTCYIRKGDAVPEPSALCNKAIVDNAFQHGTSVGAIRGYIEETSAYEMVSIGADVACSYGLCGPPGFEEIYAIPSFNCAKAEKASEIAICADKQLARHEATISKSYSRISAALPKQHKSQFRALQAKWLAVRDACSGLSVKSCLLDTMRARENELSERAP
jgi:uncharacterized protein YecT (DUF1311 family)